MFKENGCLSRTRHPRSSGWSLRPSSADATQPTLDDGALRLPPPGRVSGGGRRAGALTTWATGRSWLSSPTSCRYSWSRRSSSSTCCGLPSSSRCASTGRCHRSPVQMRHRSILRSIASSERRPRFVSSLEIASRSGHLSWVSWSRRRSPLAASGRPLSWPPSPVPSPRSRGTIDGDRHREDLAVPARDQEDVRAPASNITLEWRWGRGTTEHFPEFASDVVGLGVDLIVAANNPAGYAAQRVTHTIPIVISTMIDPVAVGFVASLARPGGNITGLTFQSPRLDGKRLQLLREALAPSTRWPFSLMSTIRTSVHWCEGQNRRPAPWALSSSLGSMYEPSPTSQRPSARSPGDMPERCLLLGAPCSTPTEFS